MRLAAIDLGSNSIHTVIVEVSELWGVARRTDLVERALGCAVRVEAQPMAEATGGLRVRSGRG